MQKWHTERENTKGIKNTRNALNSSENNFIVYGDKCQWIGKIKLSENVMCDLKYGSLLN